jgi:hypothetical protein
MAMEEDQFFGSPFALRVLNAHRLLVLLSPGLRRSELNHLRSQWVTGGVVRGWEIEMQEREGAARCPLCSRNARPRKALVGRAQLDQHGWPALRKQRASLEGAL